MVCKCLAIAKKVMENLKNPRRRYILRFFTLEFSMSSFFYETKSGIYFYQGCVIIVPYIELLYNYPKKPQTKNYEIKGVNRFSKFYFTKIKTVGTPPLNRKNYHFTSHLIYLGYSNLVLHGYSPYEGENIKKNLFDFNYKIINISK